VRALSPGGEGAGGGRPVRRSCSIRDHGSRRESADHYPNEAKGRPPASSPSQREISGPRASDRGPTRGPRAPTAALLNRGRLGVSRRRRKVLVARLPGGSPPRPKPRAPSLGDGHLRCHGRARGVHVPVDQRRGATHLLVRGETRNRCRDGSAMRDAANRMTRPDHQRPTARRRAQRPGERGSGPDVSRGCAHGR